MTRDTALSVYNALCVILGFICTILHIYHIKSINQSKIRINKTVISSQDQTIWLRNLDMGQDTAVKTQEVWYGVEMIYQLSERSMWCDKMVRVTTMKVCMKGVTWDLVQGSEVWCSGIGEKK